MLESFKMLGSIVMIILLIKVMNGKVLLEIILIALMKLLENGKLILIF
nr:MAG TPA: hypothetical protein [Caudoviricetes sp.]